MIICKPVRKCRCIVGTKYLQSLIFLLLLLLLVLRIRRPLPNLVSWIPKVSSLLGKWRAVIWEGWGPCGGRLCSYLQAAAGAQGSPFLGFAVLSGRGCVWRVQWLLSSPSLGGFPHLVLLFGSVIPAWCSSLIFLTEGLIDKRSCLIG